MKITESQLRELVHESLNEAIAEGDIDEGRFGNFLSSLGKGAQELWKNGGIDAFKQGYNQNMADKSAADAASYRQQVNLGYKDIPGADKLMAKYDGQIAKLNQQMQSAKQQISQLKLQKKQELQKLRSEHMSNMTSQANKFGNRAKNAAASAQDAQNRRRSSLGLEPVGQQPVQQKQVAESKDNRLDKVIKESIEKVLKQS